MLYHKILLCVIISKCPNTDFNFQPTEGPGLVNTFVCNCVDCRKVTASMFASNFTVDDKYIRHVRGQENLKAYSQARTIATKNSMTNYFCSTCGTLMYRISSGMPGLRFMRIGTVDDFSLHETRLRPQVEQFVETRVNWCHGLEGVPQVEGMAV